MKPIPLLAAFLACSAVAQAKPLKVFILCGQSNMEGHAQTKTFPAIAKDPKTAYLYKEIVGSDGQPLVHENIWIAYTYGDFGGNPTGKKSGKLTAGFGSQHHIGTGKIGPELTFGIYTHKALGEPILLIKNAWGGKSLMVDFRPPSGGEIADEKTREKAKDQVGAYYKHTIDHVKEVLADPKKVYPDYDEKEGYELAGFVWFQGFNDLVGPYPPTDPSQGKKSVKDYSEYSRLLGCLIRDVRKDLSAPKLPFVIGVLGVGGEDSGENNKAFREAMAAPAMTDEFKDSVTNVFTHKYWPAELDAVRAKVDEIRKPFAKRQSEINKLKKEGGDWKPLSDAVEKEIEAKVAESLSEEDKFLLDSGISNQGFHYWGSAKFFAQIGEAFATEMVKLQK